MMRRRQNKCVFSIKIIKVPRPCVWYDTKTAIILSYYAYDTIHYFKKIFLLKYFNKYLYEYMTP